MCGFILAVVWDAGSVDGNLVAEPGPAVWSAAELALAAPGVLVVAAGQEIVDGPVVSAVETGLVAWIVGGKFAVADEMLVGLLVAINTKRIKTGKKTRTKTFN